MVCGQIYLSTQRPSNQAQADVSRGRQSQVHGQQQGSVSAERWGSQLVTVVQACWTEWDAGSLDELQGACRVRCWERRWLEGVVQTVGGTDLPCTFALSCPGLTS